MAKKSKKKIIVGVIVLGIVGFIGYSSMKTSDIKPTLTTADASVAEVKSILTLTGTVKQGDVKEYISTGRTNVSAVSFKLGDEVKKGDIIASFDNTDAMDTYKQNMIKYEQQRLSLAEKERVYFETKEDIEEEKEHKEFHKKKMDEYESFEGTTTEEGRLYSLYQGKYEATKSRIDILEKSIPSDEAIKIDQLDFELTKMNLDAAEKEIAELPKDIVAEENGILESLSVKELNPVTKGQVMATIKSTVTDIVEINIGKYDVGKVVLGQTAELKIANKIYTGVVSEISAMASADSSVKAKVKVDNADAGLIPAMSADADILTYKNEKALSIPIESSKTDKTGDYCYTIEIVDAEKQLYKAVKTYIKIGNSSDTLIEVKEGLTEGQKVILNPPKTIDGILAFNILSVPV